MEPMVVLINLAVGIPTRDDLENIDRRWLEDQFDGRSELSWNDQRWLAEELCQLVESGEWQYSREVEDFIFEVLGGHQEPEAYLGYEFWPEEPRPKWREERRSCRRAVATRAKCRARANAIKAERAYSKRCAEDCLNGSFCKSRGGRRVSNPRSQSMTADALIKRAKKLGVIMVVTDDIRIF